MTTTRTVVIAALALALLASACTGDRQPMSTANPAAEVAETPAATDELDTAEATEEPDRAAVTEELRAATEELQTRLPDVTGLAVGG